jgi:lysophospholipase L1-like esterase
LENNLEDEPDRFREKGLPLIGKEVAWLNQSTKKKGSRLVVVFVPFRDRVYPSDIVSTGEAQQISEAIVDVLKHTSSQEDIPFIDLTEYMRSRAQQSRVSLYYGLDGHPNPTGYRVIAEGVAEFLAKTGVIGVSSTKFEMPLS